MGVSALIFFLPAEGKIITLLPGLPLFPNFLNLTCPATSWLLPKDMFIPLGHDQSTLQRPPVITISLIILNVVFFLITFIGCKAQENAFVGSLEKLLHHRASHPELEISEEAAERLGRLNVSPQAPPSMLFVKREEKPESETDAALAQQELNKLCDDFVKAYNQFWVFKYGFTPHEHRGKLLNYLTSMFLHAGWWHLIGNLIFLWLAGIAVEDLWGRGIFSAFYLLSGLAATLTHLGINPDSRRACIGASGAIAGLMGAFMVRHFKARIRFLYFFILRLRPTVGLIDVPAYVCLPLWLANQLLAGWMMAAYKMESGVAVWAHIGGFAFGAMVATIMHHGGIERKFIAPAIENKISFGTNQLTREALESLEKGDTAAALKKLQQRLKEQPDDLEALTSLGCVYQQTRQRRELDETYHQIIRLHLKNKDRESALEAYGLLLDTYSDGEEKLPMPAREWMALCDYLREIHRLEEAAGEYEKLARAYPADALAIRALICAAELYLQDNFNLTQARELFEKASAMNPESPAYKNRIFTGLAQTNRSAAATGNK
jgi:membrane associated rhomboid family serine protease